MEKDRLVDVYKVHLFCDKCGGLMKLLDPLAGVGTHSFGYKYRCEQCDSIMTSFIKYPYIRYEERK